MALRPYLDKTDLAPAGHDLLARGINLDRSPYEYSHHVELGREFGVSDDDIRES
jgi:hypothetical protein